MNPSEKQRTLTFLRGDSHSPVSQPLMQEREREQQMTVGSGVKCLESYGKLNRNGWWQKTFLEFLVSKGDWYSTECVLTWKLKGTKFSRLLFQLVAKVRRTEGTEFGLLQSPRSTDEDHRGPNQQDSSGGLGLTAQIGILPTPVSGNSYCDTKMTPSSVAGRHGKSIAGILSMLPTPQNRDYRSPDLEESGNFKRKQKEGWTIDLNSTIAMLPTPTARDYKGACESNPYDALDSLIEVGATKNQAGKKTGMKLHSDFVCWMMSYPIDWLDTEKNTRDSETSSESKS